MGSTPPMPLAVQWTEAGQDSDKQQAALVNLVATLKKMKVLNDTIEAEIIDKWAKDTGGKRRRQKTPKRRRVRKSTFRRHRKH